MIKCYDHYTRVYWKNTNLVNLNTLNRGMSKATRFQGLENDKAKILWDIPWHLGKCPRNGAKKPDMSVMDKVKKEWFIIEGTVCMPTRTIFKRDKYADLKLGVKSLYPGHKVRSIEVVFDFLAAYSIGLEKKLTEKQR